MENARHGWWYNQLFTNWKKFEVIYVSVLIAQILYILKFEENWSLWIVVNLANIIYWGILAVQVMTGATHIGSLGANLSQVALQAALLFNSVYATKVWSSGEADNEGGAGK